MTASFMSVRKRREAALWFFCAAALGGFLTVGLAFIDGWLYANQPAFIDQKALLHSRQSPSAGLRDGRAQGSLADARARLNLQNSGSE